MESNLNFQFEHCFPDCSNFSNQFECFEQYSNQAQTISAHLGERALQIEELRSSSFWTMARESQTQMRWIQSVQASEASAWAPVNPKFTKKPLFLVYWGNLPDYAPPPHPKHCSWVLLSSTFSRKLGLQWSPAEFTRLFLMIMDCGLMDINTRLDWRLLEN